MLADFKALTFNDVSYKLTPSDNQVLVKPFRLKKSHIKLYYDDKNEIYFIVLTITGLLINP